MTLFLANYQIEKNVTTWKGLLRIYHIYLTYAQSLEPPIFFVQFLIIAVFLVSVRIRYKNSFVRSFQSFSNNSFGFVTSKNNNIEQNISRSCFVSAHVDASISAHSIRYHLRVIHSLSMRS